MQVKPVKNPKYFFLLTVQKRFLCCSSFVCPSVVSYMYVEVVVSSFIPLLIPREAVLRDCGVSCVFSLTADSRYLEIQGIL